MADDKKQIKDKQRFFSGNSSTEPFQGKVYFIDFGLGFHSSKAEDKATDLHVLKEALEAKHPASSEELWNNILQGYKKSKNAKATIGRLEKVELRGRYKEQY